VPAICQSPKSLRATTAKLDDLRAPLLGCTDQIVRAESAFRVDVTVDLASLIALGERLFGT
jgi:hypothetical protein